MKESIMNNQNQYFVEWDIVQDAPMRSNYAEIENLPPSMTVWHFTEIADGLNDCTSVGCGYDDSYYVSTWMQERCDLVCFEKLSEEWKQIYIEHIEFKNFIQNKGGN